MHVIFAIITTRLKIIQIVLNMLAAVHISCFDSHIYFGIVYAFAHEYYHKKFFDTQSDLF